jgi:hypothetical protein
MRFREDKPGDLDRARAEVTAWREQNPAGTADQLTAALGSRFHPDYGPVLRAVLATLDRTVPEQAGQYLAVIAARLIAGGITCRLPRDGTGTLTAEEPGGAPNPVTVVIETGNGPGFWIDCTCTWTPPAATTPDDVAGTVLAVLDVIRPASPAKVPPDGTAATRRSPGD